MLDKSIFGETFYFINNSPADRQAMIYGGVLAIYGIAVISVLYLIKRHAPRSFRGISTSILSPLGAIFGLTATFLIADVWNKNADAQLAVNNEALAINQILNISSGLPKEISQSVRDKTQKYWRTVINEELPILATIKTIDNEISRRARHELYEVASAVASSTAPASLHIFNLVDDTFKYRSQRMVVAVDVTESKRIELCIFLAAFLILAVAITHNEKTHIMIIMTFSATLVTSMVICFAAINGKPFDYKASLLTKAGFFKIVEETELLSKPNTTNPLEVDPFSGNASETIRNKKYK